VEKVGRAQMPAMHQIRNVRDFLARDTFTLEKRGYCSALVLDENDRFVPRPVQVLDQPKRGQVTATDQIAHEGKGDAHRRRSARRIVLHRSRRVVRV